MSLKRIKKDVYSLDFTINHKRTRKQLRGVTEAQAREYHDKLKAQAWDKEYLGKEPEKTWDDVVQLWIDTHQFKRGFDRSYQRINFFNSFVENGRFINIEAALNHLKATQTTKNRYRALVRAMYNFATRCKNWDVKMPYLNFHKEHPRELYLTKAQFKELLCNLPDKVRDTVIFAVETGLRKSNILGLRYHQVDLTTRTVCFNGCDMKNSKPVTLPLSNKALDILERNNYRLRFTSNDYLLFKKAAKKIGIPELRFHDLRHTFASWKAQEGVPIEILSKLLGHSSLAMTERYRHLSVESLREYI